MMNRRTFLTRLATGVIGVSLVDVQWVPTAITSELSTPVTLAALTDMRAMTAEMLRRVVAELPGWRGRFEAGDYRLGQGDFTDQFMFGLNISELEAKYGVNGANVDAYLMPAARAVAHEIHDKRMTRFGALPIPRELVSDDLSAVATDELTGITLRGLKYYDIGYTDLGPGWRYRFDVLGGKAA